MTSRLGIEPASHRTVGTGSNGILVKVKVAKVLVDKEYVVLSTHSKTLFVILSVFVYVIITILLGKNSKKSLKNFETKRSSKREDKGTTSMRYVFF